MSSLSIVHSGAGSRSATHTRRDFTHNRRLTEKPLAKPASIPHIPLAIIQGRELGSRKT